MIEIEDYDPFIIAIKLMPGLNLDSIKKDMRKILSSKSYKVPVEPVEMPFKIGPPYEPLGFKNDVEIRLNLQKESFNIIGDSPDSVKEVFEEFNELISKLKYEKDEIIFFYEIFSIIGIKSDEDPLRILGNSVKADIQHLKSISPKTSFTGFHISTKKHDLDQEDAIDIVIEPKKGSESNRYKVKLRFQTKKIKTITEFSVIEIIIPIITSLEGN